MQRAGRSLGCARERTGRRAAPRATFFARRRRPRKESSLAIEGVFYVYADVSDLARAKRFYGDQLGWRLGTDEPGIAGFWFGAGYLVARQSERGAGEPRRTAGGMHVAVRVDDLDAQHARLRANGVAVSEIHARPWGERSFSFADPDGYLWEYGQPAS